MPLLQVRANGNATVILTDLALTADSFDVVTVTGTTRANATGLTVIGVNERSIRRLSVAGDLVMHTSITVTEAISLAGTINDGGSAFATPTFTIASTAVMTVGNDGRDAGILMPLVNNGVIRIKSVVGGFFKTTTGTGIINNGLFDVSPAFASNPFVIGGLSGFVNRGIFAVNTSRSVYATGQFDNYGRVELNNGLFYPALDGYRQYEGVTRLNGGQFAVRLLGTEQPVYLYGGTLSGSGVVSTGIENRGGTVLLDGTLTLGGRYVQGVMGMLQVTLTGAASGSVGVMNVTQNGNGHQLDGVAQIDGTLIVNAAGGFRPTSGNRFAIISCAVRCEGVFQQSVGNVAPAFSGYAGGGQVIVAEPDNVLTMQARSLTPLGARGKDNGYTVSLFNPTTQTIQVSGIDVSIPISFAYKPGSTTGIYTANPTEGVQNGRRLLGFMGPITVAARTRIELQFGIVINNAAPSGNYTIDINTRQTSPITLTQVAPIIVQFGSVVGVSIGVGTVVTQDGVTHILMHVSTTNIPITVKVACPPELEPCGTLRRVFAAQVVNGKYVQIIALTQKSSLASAPSNFITEWFGEFKKAAEDLQSSQFKLFTDFENYSNCLEVGAYKPGIGDPSCKRKPDDPNPPPPNPNPPGDIFGRLQLYDPSGVIRDAATRQPIPNATVTLYRIPSAFPDTPTQTRDCRTIDTRGGNVWTGTAPGGGAFEQPGFTPAQISPNVNPQITGDDGRYGWNVVTGCWYVTVSAPGYIAKTSALVGVPPEVTDLDIDLTAGETQQRKVYLPSVRK